VLSTLSVTSFILVLDRRRSEEEMRRRTEEGNFFRRQKADAVQEKANPTPPSRRH
jgi:hypothetical protein